MDVVNFPAIIANGRLITELQLENADLLVIGKKVKDSRNQSSYQNFAVSIEDFIDLLPPPVSVNIYNSNGTFTAPRSVNFGGHSLQFGTLNDAKVGINILPLYELHVNKSGAGQPVTAMLETGPTRYARLSYMVGGSDTAHLTLHGKTDEVGTWYQGAYVLSKSTTGNLVISNESNISSIALIVDGASPAISVVPEIYIQNTKVMVNAITGNATFNVKGAGAGNSTYSLHIRNFADAALAYLRDDGGIIMGINANTTLGSGASIVIGQEASATGANAVVMGIYSSGTRPSTTALGTQSVATADYAAAIGSFGTASAFAALALGTQCTASGNFSVATAYLAAASGANSIAIGVSTIANSVDSLSLSSFAEARAQNGVAVGYFTKASHRGAIVMGYGNYSSGYMESTHDDALFLGWLSTTPSFALSKTADSYLNGSGNVGIGTNAGITSKLTVNGDVETLTNNRGFIVLDRTNGNRYRIFTNAGVLSVELA